MGWMRRFCSMPFLPLVVMRLARFPKEWREDRQRLEQLPVRVHNDQIVPLGELADVILEETPPSIEHEASQRRTFIQCNVRGRDVASFVAEAQAAVKERVVIP